MTYKINLEIPPASLRLLIDLVSDAQNRYAERITMTLCHPCRTKEENEARLDEAMFSKNRYNEYTDLLKRFTKLHQRLTQYVRRRRTSKRARSALYINLILSE